MLVDDSATTLMLEKAVLESSTSYDLVLARNGEEAVEKAVSEKPDLILMDVVMPRMDGFEACRNMRAREETKSTPIILVTTRGSEQDFETGYMSGCNDYITKPFEGPEITTLLKHYLGE